MRVLATRLGSGAARLLRRRDVRWHGADSAEATAARKKKLELRSAYTPERVAPFREFLGLPSLSQGEVIDMSRQQIHDFLVSKDDRMVQAAYLHADSVTDRFFRGKVHFRGLIEFSNVCQKNCGYCGIRHDIKDVKR